MSWIIRIVYEYIIRIIYEYCNCISITNYYNCNFCVMPLILYSMAAGCRQRRRPTKLTIVCGLAVDDNIGFLVSSCYKCIYDIYRQTKEATRTQSYWPVLVAVEFDWHRSIARPWEPCARRKDLRYICHTSRVIANFVSNFVAMVAGRSKWHC